MPSLFLTFRAMVACGFLLIALFGAALWFTAREAPAPRWLFRIAVLALPLPWIAIEFGWFVAEFGRQPWIIEGVLPTALATSELGIPSLLLTLAGFTLIYGVLAVIEVRLMLRAIAKGPETLVEDPAALFPGTSANEGGARLVAAQLECRPSDPLKELFDVRPALGLRIPTPDLVGTARRVADRFRRH